MHAEPITCYRPRPEVAAAFASLPYDVFDRAEARSYVDAHPGSFLAIDRPETSFAPDHDPYASDVYERARELLEARMADGTLLRDEVPCYYLYRLRQDGREQTGIVCACALDDYADGTIRRHELTRRDKEDDRVRHIEATGCQTGPIFLAYRDSPACEALVEAEKSAEPLYDFTDELGVQQSVWRVALPTAVNSLDALLGHVERTYIADGHHRAASAARVCQELREARSAGTQDASAREPYDSLLCVLFPASQLRVLPYNRVVADVAGLSEPELIGALERTGLTVGSRRDAPVTPERRGVFGMYAFGAWRELSLAGSLPAGPVEALDVSILQDRVLGPVLDIDDPRGDPRVDFVGGAAGPAELERRAGEGGVAFSLFATSVEELMEVADAGRLMPPKSTWFEPKLRSGLFIRRIMESDPRG